MPPDPPAWTIRSATESDLDAVLSLWARAGGAASFTDTREGLVALLATDPQALLVAEADGGACGTLIAAWDGWRGSFYRLAVDPERRRQGIGTALLRAGEGRLRELGAARFTAIVADDDPAALAFWESAGYARQGNRARFVATA